ncbi:tRNA pseudouridine(13) synthase [Theileria orientalis]|uniref:tRNA pseudouridine(13) synthase n=1 Tax=Theileria orientalis TaxID=68886 RepID=A0A976MCA0_THEOR|nr:tRNA pseudouridine(13) synthase [Theileria orientalis]
MERLQSTKMVSKSISVGIERTLSEYISQIKPNRVEGYVKVLLEDFHVHEIDPEGKVLNLGKSYQIEQIRRAVERKKKKKTGEKFLSSYEEGKDKMEYPPELFTETDKVRMRKLLQTLSDKAKSASGQEKIPFTFVICSESKDAKATRTSVHKWIRANLPFLESKTVELSACQKAEKMKEHLGSYLDFSALPQDYSLIHVAPTQACVKYLSGRGRDTDSTSEHNNSSNTNYRYNHGNNRNYVSISGSNHNSSYTSNSSYKKEEDLVTRSQVKENYNSDSDPESSISLDEIVKEMDRTDYETFNPKSYGKFLHFNMLKINRETSEVVHMMCKSANRASFDFFSAGNKDKRGITVQRLCIRRCNIESILEAMTRGWYNDVYLSDFCYKNTKIGLGDLNGNHFKIVIRGIEDATNIDKSIETLKSYGFINYFGLQRFGTKIVGTHIIGASIIDQRYDMTLRLILGDIETAKHYAVFNKYFENMDAMKLSLNPEYIMNNINANGDMYDTSNISAYGSGNGDTHANNSNTDAYGDFGKGDSTGAYPNKYGNENTDGNDNEHRIKDREEETTMKYRKATDYYLLDNDAQTALKYIPVRLYVEKSILKGIMANMSNEKCLEKVPKNILTIYVHSTQSLLFNLAATERLNRYGLKVVPGDLVVTNEKGISESEESEEGRINRDKRMTVIEVNSKEEAERYTIEQVVLPLPGDNITYPRNMRDYYEKIAVENYNIKLENFKTNKQVEGKNQRCIVSVGGSYRFIIVKPKDVSYELIEKLEEPLKVLIRPEIEGYEEEIEKYESVRNIERIQQLRDKIRNKSALKLRCSLPKSSYITVALREILKDESIENNHG